MLADHGYRNGFGRPRAVAIGTWPVDVRAPRVRDLPDDAEPFHSSILPRRRMLSAETQRLFARLYLEGLSSGDFEPAFRELLGETATLSSSTILRLKDEWASRVRRLAGPAAGRSIRLHLGRRDLLGAGIELENSCLWWWSAPARMATRSCWPGARLSREHRVLGERAARHARPWPQCAAAGSRRRRARNVGRAR